MPKLARLRQCLDHIPWVRRLKPTRVGRAIKSFRDVAFGSARRQETTKWVPSETEIVPCPLCDCDRFDPVCRNEADLLVARCDSCDLVYARERPTASALKERYASYIWQDRMAWDWDEWMAERNGRLDSWGFREYEESLGPGRSVLEVGCAEGYQLKVFEQRGWRVNGIEVAGIPARFASEELHLPVSVGTLESVDFPPESFELVVMFHVLEHLTDPRSAISTLHRVLRPHGRLLIVTPCCDSVVAKLVGSIWFQDADHVAFYSKHTVHRLLASCGFKVLKSESWIGTVCGGESGPDASFVWRALRPSRKLHERIIEQNEGDIMMVLAEKCSAI